MAIIYHQVLINAVRAKIYEALTTQEGVAQWWTSDCIVKPQVGFVNEFGIGTRTHYRMRVVHLQPPFSVEWKCLNQHDDWSGTQLSFHLTDRGDLTCVDFKHSGFTSESEAFGAANFQWARQLLLLKEFCETGENANNNARVEVPATALHVAKV